MMSWRWNLKTRMRVLRPCPQKHGKGSLFRPLWTRHNTDSSGDARCANHRAPPERYEPLTGTAQWMNQHGTPPRVRGNRAMEISKALTQVLRHAAPRLGIHMEEDGFVSMGDLLKALQPKQPVPTRSEEATCFHQHFTAKLTAPLEALVQENASGNLKVSQARAFTQSCPSGTPELSAV